jgi:hypothetical protein
MGPAYFTKLIYFLRASQDGYIMDQWTARSINLLRTPDQRLVRMHIHAKGQAVSSHNDAHAYEEFCRSLEELSDALFGSRLPVDVDRAERQIFSRGHGRGAWRKYLIEQQAAAST